MSKIHWLLGGAASLSLAAASPAMAQGYTARSTNNWYAGASVGQSDYDASNLDESWAYKVYGGYDFTPWLSGQVGYANLGEFDADVGTGEVEVDGFEIAAVGRVPISNQFSVFGKVGAFAWDASVSGTGVPVSDDDGTDMTYGVGADFAATEQIGVNVQWERYADVSEEDIDVLSGGIELRF